MPSPARRGVASSDVSGSRAASTARVPRARFSQAASHGLEVGRGQTGGQLQLPAGIPAQIAQQLGRLAHDVFTQSFVDAMRPSMLLGVLVILIAAAGVLGVRARASRPDERAAGAQAYQEVAPVA